MEPTLTHAARATLVQNGDLLPFAQSPPPPGPINHIDGVHDVDGTPVRFVAERWRLADLWACPYAHAVEPDPTRPGEGLVTRAISLVTGRHSLRLSSEEIAGWRDGAGPDSRFGG